MKSLSLHAGDRVLFLAPHPDDESLAAGGLLHHAFKAGAEVRVLFATDGENNAWPQRIAFQRWSVGQAERRRWGQLRRQEALAALHALGLKSKHSVFLGYPDQGLTDVVMSGNATLLEKLIAEINELEPTLLIAPSCHDLHPDHNALGLLARFALARCAMPNVLHLAYRVHGAGFGRVLGQTYRLSLDASDIARKQRAIASHATQMLLSRRRFMRYATSHETFVKDSEDFDFNPGPVLRYSRVHPLRVRMRGRGLGTVKLSLVARAGYGLAAEMPLRKAGGTRDAGHAPFHAVSLRLPNRWAGSDVWIKCARTFKFLDAAGWQPLPVKPAAAQPLNVCCVIPCYNIDRLCGAVVREAAAYANTVIAVDDGSSDGTLAVLEAVAADKRNVHVLAHHRNHGKGVALVNAFRFALAASAFDVIVALDGDGQHRPVDIPRLAAVLRYQDAALVVGERAKFDVMPFRSRFGNELTRACVRFVYPDAPRDTQSGFRALSRKFMTQIIDRFDGSRYETELYMLLYALERGERIGRVEIPTIYEPGNRSSHFSPVADSIRIFGALGAWVFMHGNRHLIRGANEGGR
ncbi:MAG: hypothetical protein JWN94_4017 [Betaproteobacteria bacterium]|nr:hypothetical protein [Betaproteobacteria bacterium]